MRHDCSDFYFCEHCHKVFVAESPSLPGTFKRATCDECGSKNEVCIVLFTKRKVCRRCAFERYERERINPRSSLDPCSHCGGNGYEP